MVFEVYFKVFQFFVRFSINFEHIFGKNKIINTKKELAADLMKYMLLGDKEEGRKELLGRLIEARKVIMPTEPNTPYWRNFKGKDVPYNLDEPTKGVRLPNPIK